MSIRKGKSPSRSRKTRQTTQKSRYKGVNPDNDLVELIQLSESVPKSILLTRLSGDEFITVSEDILEKGGNEEESLEALEMIKSIDKFTDKELSKLSDPELMELYRNMYRIHGIRHGYHINDFRSDAGSINRLAFGIASDIRWKIIGEITNGKVDMRGNLKRRKQLTGKERAYLEEIGQLKGQFKTIDHSDEIEEILKKG